MHSAWCKHKHNLIFLTMIKIMKIVSADSQIISFYSFHEEFAKL